MANHDIEAVEPPMVIIITDTPGSFEAIRKAFEEVGYTVNFQTREHILANRVPDLFIAVPEYTPIAILDLDRTVTAGEDEYKEYPNYLYLLERIQSTVKKAGINPLYCTPILAVSHDPDLDHQARLAGASGFVDKSRGDETILLAAHGLDEDEDSPSITRGLEKHIRTGHGHGWDWEP